MDKSYYIFQQHNVIHKISNASPVPLGQHDLNCLAATIEVRWRQELMADKQKYVVELSHCDTLPAGFTTTSLRTLVGWVSDHSFSCWCRAAQILHQSRTHKFCGFCGTQTIAHPCEQGRLCPACQTTHYPTISPCIIVLVYRGETILLARSPRFRKRIFSTLAGFVEPGESAEEALRREVDEEVGIKVKNISYFTSQPWPFPSQLMLGFFAEYASGKIRMDGVEICEASWYEFDRLPEIPGKETIAGQLIRSYTSLRKE